jgi:hypothetical protein
MKEISCQIRPLETVTIVLTGVRSMYFLGRLASEPGEERGTRYIFSQELGYNPYLSYL